MQYVDNIHHNKFKKVDILNNLILKFIKHRIWGLTFDGDGHMLFHILKDFKNAPPA